MFQNFINFSGVTIAFVIWMLIVAGILWFAINRLQK